DVESKIASAEEKGIEKGLKQGLEKGLEQGIEQGVSLATKNIALNLAKAGTPLSVIALATGLSETFLNQLLNN
ncbi:MAG: transposase, partial [Methylococcales bacterium]